MISLSCSASVGVAVAAGTSALATGLAARDLPVIAPLLFGPLSKAAMGASGREETATALGSSSMAPAFLLALHRSALVLHGPSTFLSACKGSSETANQLRAIFIEQKRHF